MQALKEGQSKDDLPEEIRPKSGYGNTYAKLWWNRPSTTITRNFACPSSSRCIHPRDSRAMSIREGARLQSFPDTYKFYGSDSMKRLQIGNAVPPLVPYSVISTDASCKAVHISLMIKISFTLFSPSSFLYHMIFAQSSAFLARPLEKQKSVISFVF
ncbi:MAG TPA: DNA cytosine methyltransferase [Clostridiales bacterium]|nr:DNA cytosine methyltransferase [Clostridiales bacterium]